MANTTMIRPNAPARRRQPGGPGVAPSAPRRRPTHSRSVVAMTRGQDGGLVGPGSGAGGGAGWGGAGGSAGGSAASASSAGLSSRELMMKSSSSTGGSSTGGISGSAVLVRAPRSGVRPEPGGRPSLAVWRPSRKPDGRDPARSLTKPPTGRQHGSSMQSQGASSSHEPAIIQLKQPIVAKY